MINFVITCLFFLCCVFRVTSAPVIKASGVQWSEPKGSGKGNITLVMIPQSISGSNESDMIVAVKSDYQILSQDTQLLNLVVNENLSDKPNVYKCSTDSANYVKIDKNVNKIETDKNIKCPNTVKFFEPDKKLDDTKTNGTIISKSSLSNDQNYIKYPGAPNATDYSLKNIFNLLNLSDPNSENFQVNNKADNFNMSVPTDSTAKLFNILNISEPNNEIVTESNSKVIDGNSVNFTSSLVHSNDSFFNEALNLIDKLKQNPSFYENEKSNTNFINVNEESHEQGETKHFKEDDLALTSDEGEYLNKEPEQAINNGIDQLNLQGNFGETTCKIPATINWTLFCLTARDQMFTEKIESLKMPETTTAISSIPTITFVNDNYSPVTQVGINFGIPSAIPQGAREQTLTQGFSVFEQTNIPPTTELCTTIIVQCNASNTNAVFDKISQMVAENKKEDITTAKTENVLLTDTPGSQVGKQASPKKITLEPPLNCETLLKARGQRTTLAASNSQDSQLKNEDLAFPLVESSVFLANNNEMPKGKHIPIVLNTSLDDFSLTDLLENNDHGKIAELYNNNPLILNVGSEVLADNYSKPLLVPTNDNKKLFLKSPKVYREKILSPDVNQLLKMHFAGKNVILEQRPSYRSEMSDKHCESTPDTKSDDSNQEMEPDDDESQESQPTLPHKTTTKIVSSSELPVSNEYSQPQSSSPMEISTTQSDLTQSTDEESILRTTLMIKEKTTQNTDLTRESDDSGNTRSHFTSSRKVSTTPADVSITLEEESTLPSKPDVKTTTKKPLRTTTFDYGENVKSSFSLPVKTTTKKPLHTTTFDYGENVKSSFNLPVKTTTKKTVSTPIVDKKSETTQKTLLEDTTVESDLTLSTDSDEDVKPHFSIPVKTTTHKPLLPKKEDENTDSESLDSDESGKSNTNEYDYTKYSKGDCNKSSSKKICITKPLPTKAPHTSPTHKCTQEQTQSCKNNVYIPANSVKEIIIQIVKNTLKPGKPDSSGSDTCYKSKNEMRNTILLQGQDLYHDARNGFVKPPSKTDFIEQEILDKSADPSFNIAPRNQLNSKPSRKNDQMDNLEHYSDRNEFPFLDNESILIGQNKINNNKQKPFQRKNAFSKLTREQKNVAEHHAKSLAANILQLLINDKSVIKQM